MPIVEIKGVGPAQFPDNMSKQQIGDFLRAKYTDRLMAPPTAPQPRLQTIEPTEPTLAERGGQFVSDTLTDTGIISDPYRAQRIGSNISALGEFLPGLGDATAGDEFGRAVREGDNLGMGMAALGAVPVVGDAAKKVFKGKGFHQTSEAFDDFDFNKTSDGTVWFTDDKANFSDPSSSAGAAAGKGRIIEKDIELNKVAGYDELDKYSVDELMQQGYDGAYLDGDIQVFDPKAIKRVSGNKAAPKLYKDTLGRDVAAVSDVDFDFPITHSGGEISEIEPGGVFEGLFGVPGDYSSAGLSSDNIQTTFYPRKGKIMGEGDVDVDYDDAMQWLEREFPDSSEDQKSDLYEIIMDDADVFSMDNNPLSEHGFDDIGEASWEGQRLRGKYAVDKGYDAVAMDDETGVSYLIPFGSKAVRR